LFNYGFIFEITEHPSNYAFYPLQKQGDRALEYSYLDNESWSYLVPAQVPTEGVYAGTWLSSSMSGSPVYADLMHPEVIAYGHISPDSVIGMSQMTLNRSLVNAYVYLGAQNVQQGSIAILTPNGIEDRQISSFPTLSTGSRVYSNGLAEVNYYA